MNNRIQQVGSRWEVSITCRRLCAGVENQMNCNRCVVHVLIQRLSQHTHVLFKVAPQEGEDIVRSGVNHVTDSLQQKEHLSIIT